MAISLYHASPVRIEQFDFSEGVHFGSYHSALEAALRKTDETIYIHRIKFLERCNIFENQLLSLIDTDNEKTQFHSNVYKYALKCIKTIQAVDSTLTGYVLDLAVAQQDTCSIMELNPLETSGFFLSDYSRTLKTISTLLKQKSVE